MNRRRFLALGGGVAAMSVAADAAESKPAILELQKFRLRNTKESMVQRTTEFFGKAWVPALARTGVKPVGVFMSLIAPDTPFLVMLTQYPSLSSWESSGEKLRSDREFARAQETFYSGPLQYVRSETTLLRGFTSMPTIEAPAALPGGQTRIFELRTYESNNRQTLARKIRMFDEGEIAIFRKVGMAPVFFGETIAGQNMPNLTYMVGFNDLASRERIWSAFGASPDWQKLRSTPGLSDAEIVSNISNVLLRPLPFSTIL